MPTAHWQVVLDGRSHDVVAHIGYWSARRTVEVDGHLALEVAPRWFEVSTYWQSSTEHQLEIGGHPAALRVMPGRLNYRLDLVVDGVSVSTGSPAGELPPAKLTGRSRADEALRAPVLPLSRLRWKVRAAGTYLTLVGVALFVVGTGREAFVGKQFSEAGVLGFVTAGLGGVIVLATNSTVDRSRRQAALAVSVIWLVSMALSLPIVLPPVERIRALSWAAGLVGREPVLFVLDLAFGFVAMPAVVGVIAVVHGLFSLGDARSRSVSAAVLGAAALAAGLSAALEFADTSPLRWLDPTSTVLPHLLVLASFMCVLLIATGDRYLPASSATIVSARDNSGPRPVSAALLLALVALGSGAAAPLFGPLDAPRLEVSPSDASLEARVRRIFDETRVRAGLSGDGLRFDILFEPRTQEQFGSVRRYEGGLVRISIDSRSELLRQEHLLAYHFAGALLDAVAFRAPYLTAGYAYWAAHNSLNPFVSSAAPGDRASICRGLPTLDLTTVNDSTFVPLSLPFVLAERQIGPRGAQDLIRRMTSSPPSPQAWRQQVTDACRTLLGGPPGP